MTTIWIAAEIKAGCTFLYAVDPSGQLARKTSITAPDEAAWIAAVTEFAETEDAALVTCGMASDGYRPLPAKPIAETLAPKVCGPLTRIGIRGLSQSSPTAITSGAETRISGFLSLNPDFDGVLCLPDMETTWAHISAGEVVSMQTFATQHLATALSDEGECALPDPSTPEFDDALSDTISKPERLAAKLASARAEARLQDHAGNTLQAQTWGALLGAELSATRPYWLGQQVAVISEPKLGALYSAALGKQGLPPILADGEAMLLKGFALAWKRCKS
ncbi:2-dehydro-3-deoxygalactonokinase [Actibacterium pelagium]|uniref:2-dehydro-3-deoxygalactonokinase n=1 Tax=Actibacterium pelagium TaxID=2029103 RepID=UPI001304080B|nr:2-dehydro-3-deoxygalactonokinase [Actibacterium pelagium]